MLELLSAANVAYGIIKKTIENGKEISSCGAAIAKFVQSEDQLQQDLHKKRNSIWTTFLGKSDNDLEEFMALEEIRVKKAKLKEFMQLYGRPGLYNDYVNYCAEARRKRKETAQKRAKKKREIEDIILKIILGVLILGLVVGVIGTGLLIAKKQGYL